MRINLSLEPRAKDDVTSQELLAQINAAYEGADDVSAQERSARRKSHRGLVEGEWQSYPREVA